MKRLVLAVLAVSMLAAGAYAASKSYQVTGPVLEVTDNSITVQKGKEKWQIIRDANTKVTGELKQGSKVTVYYEMKATEIEVKDAAKK